MKYLLLGGPKDGLTIETDGGPPLVFPCMGPAVHWFDGPEDSSPVRPLTAVYDGPRLRSADRSPDTRALRFQGYR